MGAALSALAAAPATNASVSPAIPIAACCLPPLLHILLASASLLLLAVCPLGKRTPPPCIGEGLCRPHMALADLSLTSSFLNLSGMSLARCGMWKSPMTSTSWRRRRGERTGKELVRFEHHGEPWGRVLLAISFIHAANKSWEACPSPGCWISFHKTAQTKAEHTPLQNRSSCKIRPIKRHNKAI